MTDFAWQELPAREEILNRVSRFQEGMRDMALDAVWIIQPVDLYYFARTAQFGLMVIPGDGDVGVWIRKNLDRARVESCFHVDALPTYRHWADMMAERGWRADRVGLEMDVLPAAEMQAVKHVFPNTEFVDVSLKIRAQRQVKSHAEQACIREAGRRLCDAFVHLKNVLRVGMSERDIVAELDTVLRQQGDPGIMRVRNWRADLSPVVVSAGAAAAAPVAFDGPVGYIGSHPGLPAGPSDAEFKSGEPLMVDIVASAGGYFADATRVFMTASGASKWRDRQDWVRELMTWIESQLAHGGIPADIYEGAVTRAERAGFGRVFMNHGRNQVGFVGHGVGLELDEWPVFFGRAQQPLRAGMTVALEPKLIFEDGGVGIENTYVIRDNQPPENVTPLTDDLFVVPD